jgi:hypothetical protein
MLNVTELENKHKEYKSNTFVQKLKIIIPIVLIILFVVYYFSGGDDVDKSKKDTTLKKSDKSDKLDKLDKSDRSDKKVKKQVVTQDDTIQETILEVIDEDGEVILKPSFSFLDDMEMDRTQEVPPKEQFKTKESDTKDDDIKDIITIFKNNNDPALGLLIAKKYYNRANYQKAYDYSLITKNIDSNMNEAWIIFAKSLVKLNLKYKAMDALSSYIEETDSSQAKSLLEDIDSGRFSE